MRKAVVIATKSRRAIPLHWNERCQHKHNSNHIDECTVDRRIHNKIARNKTKNQMRAFHGDWEDFVPVFIPKPYLD